MGRLTACLSAALLATAAPLASAATYSLTPVVTESYQLDGTPIPGAPDKKTRDGNDRIFKVEFHATTSNLLPGERGFGIVSLGIDLSSGLSSVWGGWEPNTETTDSNGTAIGGTVPLYLLNDDFGSNTGDLKGIAAAIPAHISDPHPDDMRFRVGQPGGPSLVGSIYVQWDAESLQSAQVRGIAAHYLLGPQFITYGTNGMHLISQPFYGASESVIFGSNPEPSSIALSGIALAALAALRMRRRKS